MRTHSEQLSISQSLQKLSAATIDRLVNLGKKVDTDRRTGKKIDKASIVSDLQAIPDQQFFSQHTFEVLSVGNTLNIKITNSATQEIKVLGIAKQMSNAFLPVITREILKQQGVVACKYSVTMHDTSPFNIILTDYYPEGSFDNLCHRKNLSTATQQEACADNILKMAKRLQVLEQAGVFFSYAKAANWLLDSEDLVIADEKSLRTFEQAKLMGRYIRTGGYWPELKKAPKNAEYFEKIHAYILGANIYLYLSKARPPKDIVDYDHSFSDDVFKGDIGQRYKSLILNLTNPDASKRMGLKDAIAELEGIQQRLVLKKSLVQLYRHAEEALSDRYFACNADASSINASKDFKTRYQSFKGDALKTEILIDLKSKIDSVDNKEALAKLKKEIMGDKTTGLDSSPEFKILEKHQGLISNVFIKTTSHQALEKIFAEKEASFDPIAPY